MRTAAALALAGTVALAAAGTAGAASGASAPRDAIRVGGPSAPEQSKVAIVGSDRRLGGRRFRVLGASGDRVLRGRLRRAPGSAAPWAHAYRTKLTASAGDGRPSSILLPAVARLSCP